MNYILMLELLGHTWKSLESINILICIRIGWSMSFGHPVGNSFLGFTIIKFHINKCVFWKFAEIWPLETLHIGEDYWQDMEKIINRSPDKFHAQIRLHETSPLSLLTARTWNSTLRRKKPHHSVTNSVCRSEGGQREIRLEWSTAIYYAF